MRDEQPTYLQQTVDGAVAIIASSLYTPRNAEVISTRSETLDILLDGGFRRGRVYTLAGTPQCRLTELGLRLNSYTSQGIYFSQGESKPIGLEFIKRMKASLQILKMQHNQRNLVIIDSDPLLQHETAPPGIAAQLKAQAIQHLSVMAEAYRVAVLILHECPEPKIDGPGGYKTHIPLALAFTSSFIGMCFPDGLPDPKWIKIVPGKNRYCSYTKTAYIDKPGTCEVKLS